ISSSWSTETNKVTDQFEYAYYIYTNPLFKEDVANYLSDDNFHPNNKGYTKIANEALRHISKEVDDVYDTKYMEKSFYRLTYLKDNNYSTSCRSFKYTCQRN